ncbi:hypothetical protein RJ53_10245 [Methanocalculus chunghsingensis]|uniref:Uncharacterized protein n=1 Tax=Methanocalculus chunghsingensis TaxID=156457 RepID=A0A8J8B5I3_9EURY|nr:DUF2953 domain-containing protein [Methanocalculus chunghsingensis]MBR1369836.1 hypothetical protein [Methanocalculus chunghsingensis]
MDLLLPVLIISCIGGVILPFLLSFCITIRGSLDPEGWSAGGSLGPVTILLLPGMLIELSLFGRSVHRFSFPEMVKEEKEKEIEEAPPGEEKDFHIPSIPPIPHLPISIDSVDISGRLGTGDAGETGRLYGWIQGLRGALSWTRVHISVIPDFIHPDWSIRISTRLRIRSIFHLLLSIAPIAIFMVREQ